MPSKPFPKTPFHSFSVPQDLTFTWNHKFLENLHFKASKSGKIQFLSLKFDQISVSRASNWAKNQFLKTSNLAAVHSLSPYLRPFGPHTYTNIKVKPPWFPCFAPMSPELIRNLFLIPGSYMCFWFPVHICSQGFPRYHCIMYQVFLLSLNWISKINMFLEYA